MSISNDEHRALDNYYEFGTKLASFVDSGHSLTVKDIIDSFMDDPEPSADTVIRRAMVRIRRT